MNAVGVQSSERGARFWGMSLLRQQRQHTATGAHRLLVCLLLLAAIIAKCCCCSIAYEDEQAAAQSMQADDTAATEQTKQQQQHWQLVTRAEWGARSPTSVTNFTQTATHVIVHHSYRPRVCATTEACKAAMRGMQNYHMDSKQWPDIGYSFAIGGDGNVYEGCGYGVVGAHAPNYNSRSIGLLLIGDFREEPPSPLMLQTAQSFLQHCVAADKLRPDYTLYGHRQVRSTECPGDALYALIQKWQHWQAIA